MQIEQQPTMKMKRKLYGKFTAKQKAEIALQRWLCMDACLIEFFLSMQVSMMSNISCSSYGKHPTIPPFLLLLAVN